MKLTASSVSNCTVETYSPSEHLIMLPTAAGPKEHYPFQWRLHEFRLRYPNGIVAVEILHFDVDRDLVIVFCQAASDDLGNCRGVGLVSGSLARLQQVTNQAKAQALLDLGIGCAWPVAFEDDLLHVEHSTQLLPQQASPDEPTSGLPVAMRDYTPNLSTNTATNPIEAQEPPATHPSEQGYEHRPARTVETVISFWQKVYKVIPGEIEDKWPRFVLGVAGRPLAKGPLTEEELNKINSVISQTYEAAATKRQFTSRNGATAGQAVGQRRRVS